MKKYSLNKDFVTTTNSEGHLLLVDVLSESNNYFRLKGAERVVFDTLLKCNTEAKAVEELKKNYAFSGIPIETFVKKLIQNLVEKRILIEA